jgi:2-polyprenyl-3-methyl-5-hydroxy-6-metoxy-1,4-benzoquinol methylase
MQNNHNQFTKDAWEANADIWDARMGDEGNDFFNILCWPVLASFLGASSAGQTTTVPPLSAGPLSDSAILDIACGNGLTSRRLAALGANVTAFDFSANLIEKAKIRSKDYESHITYQIIDATNKSQLLSLGEHRFDSALSNMALFDIANIATLFQTLPKLLKPSGVFIFSLTHPCFNNASSIHIAEQWDEGVIQSRYSVKVSHYMTAYHAEGVALRGQPKPQLYFERPLQYYMNIGFQNGFVVDGFEERAFPPEHPQTDPISWGGKFSEIPPVLVMRMRLME